MYKLTRTHDNHINIGRRSTSVKINEPPEPNEIKSERPEVGCSMVIFNNGFTDWWQTTTIMDILEDTPDYVKFKTLNSIYEWRII